MIFVFHPEHMAGLAAGTLKQVISSSDVLLSMVRDTVTGVILGDYCKSYGPSVKVRV